MITIDNLKKVLEELHYVAARDKNIYIREFIEFNCVIKVDFKNKKITYPEEQGMIIHRETTCNFSEPENFVVLECITSLLDKKYKPEHIELEKPMPGGHDDTGGYCDIQVKDNDGRTFILIECKKADVFENYWKKTLHDGDQLFTQTSHTVSGNKALINAGWDTNQLISCVLIVFVILIASVLSPSTKMATRLDRAVHSSMSCMSSQHT